MSCKGFDIFAHLNVLQKSYHIWIKKNTRKEYIVYFLRTNDNFRMEGL